MGYQLEGKLLEVCKCNVLCPCWVGEDPDGGTCNGSLTWHIVKGQINGVDVSGLTIGVLAYVPGNILKGNWRAVIYVDDRSTPEQQEALLNERSGKLGGPVADLAKLIGEVVAVERVPIIVSVEKGKGNIKIGKVMEAEMAPFQGATGQPISLHDAVFTTIPCSHTYMGKASKYKAKVQELTVSEPSFIKADNHKDSHGSEYNYFYTASFTKPPETLIEGETINLSASVSGNDSSLGFGFEHKINGGTLGGPHIQQTPDQVVVKSVD